MSDQPKPTTADAQEWATEMRQLVREIYSPRCQGLQDAYVGWEIYEKHSPEMKMIDAALAKMEEK
jgi:hypothetical protein